MEAHWDSGPAGRLPHLRLARRNAETNLWALSIPNAGSLILTHKLNGLIIGLKDVAPQNRPPVKTVFFAFRIMLAIGFFMIGSADRRLAALARMLLETRWYLRIVSHSWWTGFRGGGRRLGGDRERPPALGGPGMLRTADATSPLAAATRAHDAGSVRDRLRNRLCNGIYYIND